MDHRSDLVYEIVWYGDSSFHHDASSCTCSRSERATGESPRHKNPGRRSSGSTHKLLSCADEDILAHNRNRIEPLHESAVPLCRKRAANGNFFD